MGNRSPSGDVNDPPFFSILIATRDRLDDLLPCLHSLLAQAYQDYEVLVLDQSASDAVERAVWSVVGKQERLRFLRTEVVGKSRAINRLIEVAQGELLAFTDDDTIMPPDWLAKIALAFRENPDADILFGQVEASEEALHIPYSRTPVLGFTERRYLARGEMVGMGANMAMRRSIAVRAGGFDPLLGPGAPMFAAEEGDFVFRAQRVGARILLEPSVTLIHRAWRSAEEWKRVLYGYGTGDAAFGLKHLRCYDWRMLWPFLRRPGYLLGRLCYRLLCRRAHEEEHYLRGYGNGVRASLQHRIDRRTRLYIPRE